MEASTREGGLDARSSRHLYEAHNLVDGSESRVNLFIKVEGNFMAEPNHD